MATRTLSREYHYAMTPLFQIDYAGRSYAEPITISRR
jgi:hypothetical protein